MPSTSTLAIPSEKLVAESNFKSKTAFPVVRVIEAEGSNKFVKAGYIDRKGELVISPRFSLAWTFSEGLALVHLDGVGFIDRTGELVIKVEGAEGAGSFSEGRASVLFRRKAGYIDRTGTMVIERGGESFSGGLARVGSFGYIDRNGKYVWPPSD